MGKSISSDGEGKATSRKKRGGETEKEKVLTFSAGKGKEGRKFVSSFAREEGERFGKGSQSRFRSFPGKKGEKTRIRGTRKRRGGVSGEKKGDAATSLPEKRKGGKKGALRAGRKKEGSCPGGNDLLFFIPGGGKRK